MDQERVKNLPFLLKNMAKTLFLPRYWQLVPRHGMFGRVAQLVEQRTENPRVDSSILSPATTSPPFVLFQGSTFESA